MFDKTLMPVVEVSTEDFWKKMCSFSSYRIDLYNICIGMTVYHCEKPPELVVGFLDDQIEKIEQLLNPPSLLDKFRAWVRCRILMFKLRNLH